MHTDLLKKKKRTKKKTERKKHNLRLQNKCV